MFLTEVIPGQEQTVTTEIVDSSTEVLEFTNTDFLSTIIGSAIIFIVALILYFRARKNDKFTGLHIYFAINSFLSIVSGVIGMIVPDMYYITTMVVAVAETVCSILLAIYASKTDHKGWSVFFIVLLVLPIILMIFAFAMIGMIFTSLFITSGSVA